MFGFGKKNKKVEEFLIPVSGTIVNLENVNDPVFSQKLMGDGFGIEPTDNNVYAPISGEIVSLMPHAIGIKADDGLEVLIHVGLETVGLNGEGFTGTKQQGDRVEAGELVITADFDAIKDKVPAITTLVIFTNPGDHTFNINKTEVNAKDTDAVSI